MYQRVFFGKVTHEVNNTLPDLNEREKAALSADCSRGAGHGRRSHGVAECD